MGKPLRSRVDGCGEDGNRSVSESFSGQKRSRSMSPCGDLEHNEDDNSGAHHSSEAPIPLGCVIVEQPPREKRRKLNGVRVVVTDDVEEIEPDASCYGPPEH